VSISAYASFVSATLAIFDQLRSSVITTEEDVANVIIKAATGGTAQLRYVAIEDVKPLVAARRETSEAEYIKLCDSSWKVRLSRSGKHPAAHAEERIHLSGEFGSGLPGMESE